MDKCYYIYKDNNCGYRGKLQSCDKTLEDCKRHDNFSKWPLPPSDDEKPKMASNEEILKGLAIIADTNNYDMGGDWISDLPHPMIIAEYLLTGKNKEEVGPVLK